MRFLLLVNFRIEKIRADKNMNTNAIKSFEMEKYRETIKEIAN